MGAPIKGNVYKYVGAEVSTEVLPGEVVVTRVVTLRRTKPTTPTRSEGRIWLSYSLLETLFDQRGKRLTACTGVPLGYREQLRVHCNRKFLFHCNQPLNVLIRLHLEVYGFLE